MPTPKQLTSVFYRRLKTYYARGDFAWYFSRKGLLNNYRLGRLKDRHYGERCFIIGNGPSLRKMDLRPLGKEFTIGLNRIYLLFDEIGFTTSYYVSVNKLVIEQCAKDIAHILAPKFISWDARHLTPSAGDIIWLRTCHYPHFSKDLTVGMWQGATATYVAMQVAYHLGFKQVILIGVDHYFETKGKPHTIVVSEGDDRDHFDPNYFGKGFRWQLPDLEQSELAYRMAKIAFEAEKREIVDATVCGRLQIFRRVEYKDLF